jgi:colicin import membrane protein
LTSAALAARGDDRARADALLAEIAAPAGKNPAAAEPIARAKDALRRSDEARGGGDATHAALLDALGLEWAETSRDLGRAAAAEKQLAELQARIGDTEQKLTRAKALLDDTVARRGRAEHKLHELERPDGGAQ